LALLKEKTIEYSDARKLGKEARALYEKLKIEDRVNECITKIQILSPK
jgi:hypothetical protein